VTVISAPAAFPAQMAGRVAARLAARSGVHRAQRAGAAALIAHITVAESRTGAGRGTIVEHVVGLLVWTLAGIGLAAYGMRRDEGRTYG
jgi:hypothetical protein